MDRNLEKFSDEKGGPLSKKNCLGGPSCEKRLSAELDSLRSWNEL